MDPQHNTEATVARDGVTVRQTYAEKRFDIPTVALELDSGRDEPVNVRLVVDLPAALDIDEVGFHPNFRRDDWSVESRRLVFEVTVPPDRTITTVYAVESLQPVHLDALLESLQVDRVAVVPAGASGQSGDIAGSDGTDHNGEKSGNADVWTTASGEPTAVDHSESDKQAQDSTSESDEEHDSTPDDQAHDAESDDEETTPTAGAATVVSEGKSETGAAAAEESAEHGVDTTALSAYSAMDLVAELVARVEANARADTERIQSMQRGETGQSLVGDDTRVTDLQRRMSDLEALLEPLQGLPDHDPVETLEELDERLVTLAEDLETVDERVAKMDERVDERVADVEPKLDAFEEELATTRSDLDERVGEVDARVETVDSRVDTVTDEVASVANDVDALAESVESVTEDVEGLANDVEALSNDVESLRNDVATIENDQEALASEVSRLSEWRENVKNVLKTLGK